MRARSRLASVVAACGLGFVASGGAGAQAVEAGPQLRVATELHLPAYQTATLAHDLPANDIRFAADGALLILGKDSLWSWRQGDRALQRLALHPRGALRRLGDDGLSILAAGDDALYQIVWSEGRLFRFALPAAAAGGHALTFGGRGDETWLVHTGGLFKLDRYGKLLVPRFHTPFLKDGDHAVLLPEAKRLWYTRGARLHRVDLGAEGAEPVAVLKVKHELLDLQAVGTGELVTHTRHAVLYLSKAGKVLRSIPVDGNRELMVMSVGADAHSYLFDDGLLEIYAVKDKSVRRYRIPMDQSLDQKAAATRLVVAGSAAALIVDGQPRLFRLQ